MRLHRGNFLLCPLRLRAPMADAVVLSMAGPVYVRYLGEFYAFKTTRQGS